MKIDKLKELRVLKNLTQKQVASSLGMSESGYCLYENGKRKVNFDTLVALAKLYGCKVDDFID